jgi:hypothetical protein
MMKTRLLLIAGVLALAAAPLYGGTFSGSTLSLDTTPLVGVRVEAFRVSLQGKIEPTPFTPAVFSRGQAASYSIDLGDEPRVVLRFTAGADRVVVSLPEAPNGAVGGAVDGRVSMSDLNVYVPEKTKPNCCQCCCGRRPWRR